MQLNLFAPPPMPACAIQPNASGVYPDDAAESMVLPVDRPGWRGLPLAQIHLLHLPQGWLQSAGVSTSMGGFGYGLSETHSGGFHATRDAALAAAIAPIARYIERGGRSDSDTAAVRKIGAWLETVA